MRHLKKKKLKTIIQPHPLKEQMQRKKMSIKSLKSKSKKKKSLKKKEQHVNKLQMKPKPEQKKKKKQKIWWKKTTPSNKKLKNKTQIQVSIKWMQHHPLKIQGGNIINNQQYKNKQIRKLKQNKTLRYCFFQIQNLKSKTQR